MSEMELDFSQAITQLQTMADNFIRSIPSILVAVIVLIIFLVAANITRVIISRVAEDYGHAKRNVGLVLGRLSQWTVVLFGFLLAAVIVFPEFSAAEMIQLLGLGGVAIGFAFRDILQNFLVGIILLLNEPFRIGDQIVSGEYEGTVEDIRARATVVRTYDGRRVVIPNADLFNDTVVVNTAFDRRRIDYDIRLRYDTDVPHVKALILEVFEEIDREGILSGPPPDVLVLDLAEFYVYIRVRWWIRPSLYTNYLATKDRVLDAIKAKLNANGIDFPYPTREIVFGDSQGLHITRDGREE